MPELCASCIMYGGWQSFREEPGVGKGTETGKSVSTGRRHRREHLIRKQMSLPKHALLRRVLHIYCSKEFRSAFAVNLRYPCEACRGMASFVAKTRFVVLLTLWRSIKRFDRLHALFQAVVNDANVSPYSFVSFCKVSTFHPLLKPIFNNIPPRIVDNADIDLHSSKHTRVLRSLRNLIKFPEVFLWQLRSTRVIKRNVQLNELYYSSVYAKYPAVCVSVETAVLRFEIRWLNGKVASFFLSFSFSLSRVETTLPRQREVSFGFSDLRFFFDVLVFRRNERSKWKLSNWTINNNKYLLLNRRCGFLRCVTEWTIYFSWLERGCNRAFASLKNFPSHETLIFASNRGEIAYFSVYLSEKFHLPANWREPNCNGTIANHSQKNLLAEEVHFFFKGIDSLEFLSHTLLKLTHFALSEWNFSAIRVFI